MRRFLLVIMIAVFLVLMAQAAGAGGWAVGTLDEASPELRAGKPTAVGYTIRQHGRTPVDLENTAIRLRSLTTGELLVFPGRRSGAVGHYIADVIAPEAGEWTWELDMADFRLQPLGTVTVLASNAPVAPAAQPVSTPSAANPDDNVSALRRVGLPVLAAIACGVFASQVFLTVRRRRDIPVPANQ
jgi:hypothetical protein